VSTGLAPGRTLRNVAFDAKGVSDALFKRPALSWARGFGRERPARHCAIALGGGGVVGGMYEVGAVAALEEHLNGQGPGFDTYVGCSAGAVVAAIFANGIRASEVYRIVDQDIDDPLNLRPGAVFPPDAYRRAAGRLGRVLWAVGKRAITGRRSTIPDMLARAEGDLPAGFFSLAVLERYIRELFEARRLSNSFGELPRRLLIPAVDLDRAERVVFGHGERANVPISQAIAASSAIPGFFEPYTIGGRDYVDGGVGFSGHADLAAEAGADVVLVVHPLVPSLAEGGRTLVRTRGFYTIMEQTSRIYGQNLLQLGLATLRVRHPHTNFFLLEPSRSKTPLSGLCMGFESTRAALRYGYVSTREWLFNREGQAFLARLGLTPEAVAY
jgi:NTE family protein